MLDFWATWCPPCRAALPTIAKLAQDYRDRGVIVYAVNDESPDTVRAFLDKLQISLPVAMDPSDTVFGLYKASTIPQTVLIGKNGIIQDVHVGLSWGFERSLRKTLDALLAGKNLVQETQP